MDRLEEGRRFVRRMYVPRTVGLGLGAVAIGVVLHANAAHPALWAALALSTLAWPHLAFLLGRRSQDPYRTELRSLTFDSALGGAWIAVMQFNLLPSMLLVVMLSMDKVAVGGVRLLLRCSAALAAACAAVAFVNGFQVQPHTSMAQILGALPLFIVYPVAVGVATYRLARRVREQNRLLVEVSRTDWLTKLLNRQAWEAAAGAEFQRCRRERAAACVLMVDIDHFKSINDRHGHPAGDQVLRNVAAILQECVREYDVPGRYGGEEFCILLPATAAEGAAVTAERIRARIEGAVLERDAGVRATASIGYAQLEPDDADHGVWLARADKALYAAKAAGRNRCVRA
jgi:diguanylate cyclase